MLFSKKHHLKLKRTKLPESIKLFFKTPVRGVLKDDFLQM